MKIEIQIGKGEIPLLAELLKQIGDEAEIVVTTDDHGVTASEAGALPAEVLEAFQQRSNPAARELIAGFTAAEVAERGAETQVGPKYVRLYVPGPRLLGAYVYVNYAGYVSFRLPASAADGRKFARARDLTTPDTYGVRVRLTGPEALAEAGELAAEAYRVVEEYTGPSAS